MIKKFISDSTLYVLAGFFTKGIGFIMLPIYVAYLSKTELGIYDYITTVGAFIGVVIALEISQSIIRFASEFNEDQELQRDYISHGFWFTIFCYSILTIVMLLFLKHVSHFLTGSSTNLTIAILAVLSFFTTALTYLINIIYRSQLNSKAVTLSSTFSALSVAGLTTLNLVYFDFGLTGLFASVVSGQTLVILINVYRIRHLIKLSFKIDTLTEMLKFSSPLVLASIGVLMSTIVDRIMIKELLSFEDVAVYGVAARFASVLVLLTIGFQNALTPLIYNNVGDRNLRTNLQKLLCGYVITGILFIVALAVMADELVSFFLSSEYMESGPLIPLLALAVMINSAYVFFPGLSISKRTSVIAKISIVTAIVNVILNFSLITRLGVAGAAYATLISSIAYILLTAFWSERYFSFFTRPR